MGPKPPRDPWVGVSWDVSSAHKQIRISEAERGLVLFAFDGTLYSFTRCHFGGRFSAYWWARCGAAITRLLHGFIYTRHICLTYVDDSLGSLPRSTAAVSVAIATALLLLLEVPISWHKSTLQDVVTWNGWELNSYLQTISLPRAKCLKILGLLDDCLKEPCCAQSLEKTCGFARIGRAFIPIPQATSRLCLRGAGHTASNFLLHSKCSLARANRPTRWASAAGAGLPPLVHPGRQQADHH